MKSTSLVECMSTLRAVREFTDEPIPDSVVQDLLFLATRAPNDRNLQDWRFLVIRDPRVGSQVGEAYVSALLDYYGADSAEEVLADPDLPSMNRGALRMAHSMIEKPPLMVLACYEHTGLDPGMSLFPAIQNLMLAAWSQGIGSVPITVVVFRAQQELRRILDIPKSVDIVALVPMGYPAKPLAPPTRKPVESVTFYDKWGAPPDW